MNDTYKLILKRRTIRKFKQKRIAKSILFNCLNAARLAPSSANLQPLEYILVTKNLNEVFNCTRWAGYLKDGAPEEKEKPVAYIVILSNQKINKNAKYDVGLAAENIILTALERGIASCIIGSVNREKLAKILNIPQNYIIEFIIALGYPGQKSVEEKFTPFKNQRFLTGFKGSIKYWLDKKGVLHIPKKELKCITHKERF